MRIIGLTGGIGMGKSTAALAFRRARIPVFDADAAVHQVQGPGGRALPPIEAAFPGTVKNGVLDRAALRAAVLGKPEALKRLERIVHLRRKGKPQSLLDAGSGSGILAIAGAKLGYSPVEAFDYDPEAVRISKANCRLNGVESVVQPVEADLTKMPRRSRERFDVICANLICDLLIAEHRRLLARLKPRGSLVVAGILETQFPEVERALTASGLRRRGDARFRRG